MPTGYRVEVSPNNRAGCKNAECKKDSVKITKGELRFGTLVTIQEHQSMQYRHWGCVTPKVLENVKEFIEDDLDMFDGYEELPADIQSKVAAAIKNGHVDDADWKGDVECNRPGMNGFRAKAAKSKNSKGEEQEDGEESATPKPKKRAAAKREADEDDEAPKKKKRKSKKTVKDESESEEAPPPKKQRGKAVAVKQTPQAAAQARPPAKKRGKVAEVKDEEISEEEAPPPKKNRGKATAVKEKVNSKAEKPAPAAAKKQRGKGTAGRVVKNGSEAEAEEAEEAEVTAEAPKKHLKTAAPPAPTVEDVDDEEFEHQKSVFGNDAGSKAEKAKKEPELSKPKRGRKKKAAA